jgi:hypothetical protein
MSTKSVYKCAHCGRRVRRGHHANVSVRERESGLERRYHGLFADCLRAAAEYMNRYPRKELLIFYYHEPSCSARQQFECTCFAREPADVELAQGDDVA